MLIRTRRLALVALLLVIVAGCDAVGLTTPSLSADSPEGTVRMALDAVTDHDYAGLQRLTCSLTKDNAIAPFFGASGLTSVKAMGIKERELAAAMGIAYSDVSTKEIRRTDTEASVTLEATGTPTIDQAKMRPIVTKVLKVQSSKVTKAQVDAAMAALDLSPTKFSTTLTLAKKGTGWVICQLSTY